MIKRVDGTNAKHSLTTASALVIMVKKKRADPLRDRPVALPEPTLPTASSDDCHGHTELRNIGEMSPSARAAFCVAWFFALVNPFGAISAHLPRNQRALILWRERSPHDLVAPRMSDLAAITFSTPQSH